MKKSIQYAFFSVAILFAAACVNKKNDEVSPAINHTATLNLRTAAGMDSLIGNYYNPADQIANTNNEFTIRCFPKINPTDPATPLIITFHGGEFTGGDKKEFKLPLTIGNRFPVLLTCQHLDNNKFAYACVNYRLLKSGDPLSIIDCLNDCKAFVDYIRKNAETFNIDPNKIILMGFSGGASASLWMGLQNKFDAGVIKGIAVFNPQATLNITQWGEKIFQPVGLGPQYNQAMMNQPDSIAKKCKNYYNSTNVNKINEYCSLNNLNYLMKFGPTDPEVYMATEAANDDFMHHSAHVWALSAYAGNAGAIATTQFTKAPPYTNPNYESLIQFFKRKFQ